MAAGRRTGAAQEGREKSRATCAKHRAAMYSWKGSGHTPRQEEIGHNSREGTSTSTLGLVAGQWSARAVGMKGKDEGSKAQPCGSECALAVIATRAIQRGAREHSKWWRMVHSGVQGWAKCMQGRVLSLAELRAPGKASAGPGQPGHCPTGAACVSHCSAAAAPSSRCGDGLCAGRRCRVGARHACRLLSLERRRMVGLVGWIQQPGGRQRRRAGGRAAAAQQRLGQHVPVASVVVHNLSREGGQVGGGARAERAQAEKRRAACSGGPTRRCTPITLDRGGAGTCKLQRPRCPPAPRCSA